MGRNMKEINYKKIRDFCVKKVVFVWFWFFLDSVEYNPHSDANSRSAVQETPYI
jgi:hypothetical protein